MRLVVVVLAGLTASALAGCGSGEPLPTPPDAALVVVETLCSDGLDNDANGTTDCDDPACAHDPYCQPPTPLPCNTQRSCGDIVNDMVTKCCLDGKCVPPGAQDRKGEPVEAMVTLDQTFKSTLTGSTKPASVVLRFIYPKLLDGSPLTCAGVVGSVADNTKNCMDATTRSRLDTNPQINQVFRIVNTLAWQGCSGVECSFSPPSFAVPKGDNFILYGEAWYGPRELNNPTGQCASTFCVEGQSVTATGAHYRLTFK